MSQTPSPDAPEEGATREPPEVAPDAQLPPVFGNPDLQPSDGEVMAAGGIVWRRRFLRREVALVHRSRHKNGAGSRELTLPKGHVQDGETPEMAARREAEEETGWRVALRQPAGEITYAITKDADVPEGDKGKKGKRVLFWHMQAIVSYGEPQTTSKGEVEDVSWFAPRKALRHLAYREQANLLADHLSSLESPIRPSFSFGSTPWRLERLTQSLAIYAVQLEARVGPEQTPDGSARAPEFQRLWVEGSALLETSRNALGRGI